MGFVPASCPNSSRSKSRFLNFTIRRLNDIEMAWMTSSRVPSGPNGSWSPVLNCELYLDDGVQANLATAYGPNIVGPRQGKSSSVVQGPYRSGETNTTISKGHGSP